MTRKVRVEGDELAAAVTMNDNSVEFVLFPEECHRFRMKASRVADSKGYVELLDRHLRGRRRHGEHSSEVGCQVGSLRPLGAETGRRPIHLERGRAPTRLGRTEIAVNEGTASSRMHPRPRLSLPALLPAVQW